MGMAFSNYLVYMLILVGVLVVTAYLIGLMHKVFISKTGKLGYNLHKITAIVGTPIHELGHLSMNIIFRHDVMEYKLLQLSSKDGEFGYVNYTYNRKSLYQRVGNFFTALGPIIWGGFVLYGLMYFLANDQYAMLVTESKNIMAEHTDFSFIDILGSMFDYGIEIVKILFSWDFLLSPNAFILIILSFSIAFHMSLSNADIRNGISGGIIFSIVIFVFGLLFSLISPDLMNEFNNLIVIAIYKILIFFTFALVINLIMLAFSFVYEFIVDNFFGNKLR